MGVAEIMSIALGAISIVLLLFVLYLLKKIYYVGKREKKGPT